MSVHASTSFPMSTPIAAPFAHLADAPHDHRPAAGRGASPRPHRFPAATYLSRAVAREERAYALDQLAATGRAGARRIGGVAVVGTGLLATMVALVATGRTGTATEVVTLWALGAATGLTIVALVSLLRRYDRLHERLAERVRRYEARLLELRAGGAAARR